MFSDIFFSIKCMQSVFPVFLELTCTGLVTVLCPQSDAVNDLSVLQIGGGHNIHEAVLHVAEMVIRESRATRMQPFNEYRKRFNLKPYASFFEFTGKQEQFCNYNLLLKSFTYTDSLLFFETCQK